MTEPSWRKPVGILALLAYAMTWVIIVASASGWIGSQPVLVQSLIYLVAGLVWIVPLGPWLKWIETGRFR